MLDPGDEVLVPAPYWTTYPEAIRLAGGVPVPVVADEQSGYLVSAAPLSRPRAPRRTERLPGLRRPARGGSHAAHEGSALLLAVQPHRRGVPGRAGRGDR